MFFKDQINVNNSNRVDIVKQKMLIEEENM